MASMEALRPPVHPEKTVAPGASGATRRAVRRALSEHGGSPARLTDRDLGVDVRWSGRAVRAAADRAAAGVG